LLSILFGAPFRILRDRHLAHHKLNRLPAEGAEYYDRAASTKSRAAPGYYFRIFLGLYLVEVLTPLYFLLPRNLLFRLQERLLKQAGVSAMLMENWLGGAALREIRFDGCLAILWLALALACYGGHWPLLAAAVLGRAFLISFLDNVYHYGTAVGNIFYARNLALPAPLATLLLHFNLHGVHHVNPAIPWSDLPEAFEAQGGRHEGEYLTAALQQLRGPIALQDLPEGAPVVRVRPF
jgi:fatty acid desaturase